MEKRTDRLMAAYVDLAFNIAISFGLDAGIRVLHEQEVPPSVSQRVLVAGGPRRGASWAKLERSSCGAPHT
jgi:hypothetical protein